MTELEERLNALLQDPEALDQAAKMASQLMGQISPADGGASPLPDAVQTVLRSLDGGKSSLAAALSPYLSENRRGRLERALRVASAARLIGGMGGLV